MYSITKKYKNKQKIKTRHFFESFIECKIKIHTSSRCIFYFGTTDRTLPHSYQLSTGTVDLTPFFESFIKCKIKIHTSSRCIFYFGTTDGTRTHMVSRWILNPVRLLIPPQWHLFNTY